MTEIQAQVKILELNGYLGQINNIVWTEICADDGPVKAETIKKILEVLDEWADNE